MSYHTLLGGEKQDHAAWRNLPDMETTTVGIRCIITRPKTNLAPTDVEGNESPETDETLDAFNGHHVVVRQGQRCKRHLKKQRSRREGGGGETSRARRRTTSAIPIKSG